MVDIVNTRGSSADLHDVISRVSVVVGVRLSKDRPSCATRLSHVLEWTANNGFKGIIVVDTTPTLHPARLMLRRMCARSGASYVHRPLEVHSPSIVRNTGFDVALGQPTSHVLFLDVDVLGQRGSLERLARHVRENRDFEWCPVIFTPAGEGLERMSRYVSQQETRYIGPIQQTGYATGIQLVSKAFWPQLGGYDEAFIGYGCEDIEMIHRATALLGQRGAFDSDDEYFEDHRTLDPDDYRGYRLWMMQQKQHVPQEQMWVHFHHDRRAGSAYWGARAANDVRLDKKLKNFDAKR